MTEIEVQNSLSIGVQRYDDLTITSKIHPIICLNLKKT